MVDAVREVDRLPVVHRESRLKLVVGEQTIKVGAATVSQTDM
jgi:hypothetical protein